MKNLNASQIEQVRQIKAWNNFKFHGNKKRHGAMLVKDLLTISNKKTARQCRRIDYTVKTPAQITRELIKQSIASAGTPYFKVLIEGNTGIYYASAEYGHSDYNKTRVFDKTPETLKLMQLFNSYITNHTPKH